MFLLTAHITFDIIIVAFPLQHAERARRVAVDALNRAAEGRTQTKLDVRRGVEFVREGVEHAANANAA